MIHHDDATIVGEQRHQHAVPDPRIHAPAVNQHQGAIPGAVILKIDAAPAIDGEISHSVLPAFGEIEYGAFFEVI